MQLCKDSVHADGRSRNSCPAALIDSLHQPGRRSPKFFSTFSSLPILRRRITLRSVAAERFWARRRQVPCLLRCQLFLKLPILARSLQEEELQLCKDSVHADDRSHVSFSLSCPSWHEAYKSKNCSCARIPCTQTTGPYHSQEQEAHELINLSIFGCIDETRSLKSPRVATSKRFRFFDTRSVTTLKPRSTTAEDGIAMSNFFTAAHRAV
ncbi:hypothetical protein M513_12850 [Trichuris suis]|uniref:Uncharacterized protein n=1 Tax=Trichuris suis TaxID=68888 RepID=A0A085LMR6_9BILA|nr:hypothetical protein M513_12850 [Trichuris suis]